jgi:hypothetical protein
VAGLCSLTNLKLTIRDADTVDDTILQLYIDALTDEVQDYTKRQFVADAAAADYYFDGPLEFARELAVPSGFSGTITVGYAMVSQPASGGTYTTITAASVLQRPLAAYRRPGFPADRIVISDLDLTAAGFYPGYNTVKINMARGFAAVPPALERWAVAVLAMRFNSRTSGGPDSGPDDFGGSLLSSLTAGQLSFLDQYAYQVVG